MSSARFVAMRSSLLRVATRRAASHQLRLPGLRRGYADSHGAQKSSDMPWAAGGGAVTVLGVAYLMWNERNRVAAEHAEHGDSHGHEESEDKHEESQSEEKEEKEEGASKEDDEKASDSSEDKDEEKDAKDSTDDKEKEDGKSEDKSDDESDEKPEEEDEKKESKSRKE